MATVAYSSMRNYIIKLHNFSRACAQPVLKLAITLQAIYQYSLNRYCYAGGAIWSSCSPDFGLAGAADRFVQVQPKLLFSCDTYFYKGKTTDVLARAGEITQKVTNIKNVVVAPVGNQDISLTNMSKAIKWHDVFSQHNTALVFEQRPFALPLHPVFVRYYEHTKVYRAQRRWYAYSALKRWRF